MEKFDFLLCHPIEGIEGNSAVPVQKDYSVGEIAIAREKAELFELLGIMGKSVPDQ
ncbi:MAG TPA: hypothetical protein VFC44_03635 [Candidatus Saccharimonadales bacterium]|nr:hypothetical protein [Candidatus Saccharimonadales bacterium]